jgi:membrane protease YdiL (CAAX protease family)
MQGVARVALAFGATLDVTGAALVSASVFAAVAAAGAWLGRRALPAPLRLGPSRASAAGVAAAVAGTVGLSVALGSASEMLGLGDGGTTERIARLLSGATPTRIVLAVAAIAVAPGAAEEAFFRGLVQTRLVARWGRWPGVVASAVAFGVVHIDPVRGSLAALAGLFLGWVAERFESIRPTAAAHAANNAVFLALAPWMSAGAMSTAGQIATLAGGFAVFACATAFLRSRYALRSSEHRDAPHERPA